MGALQIPIMTNNISIYNSSPFVEFVELDTRAMCNINFDSMRTS